MAIDSYANLRDAIGNWLDDSSLTSHLDDYILLTEELFKRPPSTP